MTFPVLTADQNVTSPRSTQYSARHRATSSAQAAALGTINSLVAPSHRPLLYVPFQPLYICFCCILPCARPEPLYIERKRGLHIHVVVGFLYGVCATQLLYEALHEAMRSPHASYSREPNAFLVAARSACCLCRRCADPNHGDTSVPGTTYPVQHTAQHTQ